MVKKSASHRGVEDVAPYKHIFLFFGKAFMEPRHYGGVFVLQKKATQSKKLCCFLLVTFLSQKKAAVPPAKLDVFKHKRLSAVPDDFILLFVLLSFGYFSFPKEK